MMVAYMEGNFWLIVDGFPYGNLAFKIDSDVYDALKSRDFDDECVKIDDMMKRNNITFP